MEFTILAHFLPSVKHKKRAKLLQHPALSSYLLILFLLFASIRVVTIRFPGVLGYASNITTSDLLKYTNEERKKYNLAELKFDSDLAQGAEAKASNMFKYNYWAHVSPSGVEPWYFFNLVHYDYSFAGENLAKNFNDSKGVVDAWMNSPSHRENILNPNYTDIGFAVVNGDLEGYKTTLVVQFFGRRQGLAQVESIDLGGSKTQKNEVHGVDAQVSKPQEALTPKELVNIPLIDIYLFAKIVSVILGAFFIVLFMLDFWYSEKKGIVKINGHTIAHVFILLLAVVSIAFVMVPGKIGVGVSKVTCCEYGK